VNDVVEYAGFVYAATATNVNVVPYPPNATWNLIGGGGGGGGGGPFLPLAGGAMYASPSGILSAHTITDNVSISSSALADITISSLAGNDVNIEANNDVVYVNAVDIALTATDKVLVNGTNEIELSAPSLKIDGTNRTEVVGGEVSIQATGPGNIITLDTLPANVKPYVVGYDTSTKALSYFTTPSGGGGAITSVGGGANITVDNITNPAIPIVSLASPLTANLDMGTADIVTSVANADIDITTNGTGGVHIVQAGVSTNGAVRIIQTGSGTIANPALRLVNQNATGSVALEIYKNKPTAGAPSDVLHTQSVFGKDSGNNKQEYTRITHTIREATVGTEDGSIELGCMTNGTFQNYIQINGNDPTSGEVNILRPLDLASGSTGLIKTSIAGGSINITADTTGTVALNSAGGEVFLNGNSVRMNTGGVKFFECGGVITNPTFSRPVDITESAGTATFSIVGSPQPAISVGGLPLQVSSGFADGVGTGGAGQVITANGAGGWSWDTPASIPTWFSVAPSAPSGSLDMNSNNLSNVSNFSWGTASGTTEYLGTTAPVPSGSIQGSIPITIGLNTYYIPYYS
jgi:hypothetical protein